MLRTKLFRKTVIAFFVVIILKHIGDVLHLFDSIWWYDIILHLLSGALVAISAFIIWNFFSRLPIANRTKMLFVGIFSALVLGIIWEKYELYFGITSLLDGNAYIFDTTKDLIMDIIGGYAGSLYALKELKIYYGEK